MTKNIDKSLVVAITGGIGCGKTAVSNIVRDMGFIVISSDDNAKVIMIDNQNVMKNLIKTFGHKIYFEDGNLNKELLSEMVFGESDNHEKALLKLNSIVHPHVIEKMIKDVESYIKKGEKIIFVESALTFEAQLEEDFDFIIVVDANQEKVIDRIKKRSDINDEQIRFRMKQQLSQELKKQHADFVIENNGSFDELKKSTEIIVNILSSLAN